MRARRSASGGDGVARFGLRSMLQAAITSGGPTQDFDIAGIDQPKAALYQITSGLTAGTIELVARHGIGITDGTAERDIYSMWENAGTSTATHDTGFREDLATVLQISGTVDQTLDGEADHNQWNPTGSKLNWGDLPGAAFLVMPTYFFGSDLVASVVEAAGSATIGQELTVECNLQGKPPDAIVVISYHAGAFIADGAGNEARASFGVAVNDRGTIRQWCYSHRSADRPSSTANTGEMRNDCVLEKITIAGTGTRGARMEVTGFTQTGFKWTTRNTAESITGAILALSIPHRRVWAGIPALGVNNAGNRSTPDPGFKPLGYISLCTALDTVNTIDNDNMTSHFSLGACSSSEANCATIQVEDNALTSNTRSGMTAKVARVIDNSAGDIYALSHVSFDAMGFTVNVDTASPTDRLTAFLVFGEDLPEADYLRRYEHIPAPSPLLRM